MKKIYKYGLPMEDYAPIAMPVGAIVLSVGVQHGTPVVWALVNPNAPMECRTLRVAGTGHPIEEPERWEFIGTFQLDNGNLIFHVFDRKGGKG